MESKRLLIALAHPDDESFGLGGIIRRYASDGVDVSYICATKGDRGTVKPEFIEQYGSVEAVRDAELECAAQVLGFKRLIKYGYRDSDMMGSPNNNDPACLWQADEDTVVDQIMENIREIKPQVIITFDPYGAYGHPDHIFMYRATTRAFEAMAAEPNAPQKLYYTNIPRTLLRMGIWLSRLTLRNPRQFGENKDIDMVEILNHVPPAHVKINVRPWMDEWDAANRCHASQGGGGSLIIPRWVRRRFLSGQTLTRRYPEPQPGEKMERDLFEGVAL